MIAEQLIFVAPNRDVSDFISALQALLPELEILDHQAVLDKSRVIAAVVWKHREGSLKGYPNLRWVSSLGAGVDHIFQDTLLPENIKISRVVGEHLTRDMSRYVVACVLNAKKRVLTYGMLQKSKIWGPSKELSFERAGIMGAGELGKDTALKLKVLGFEVAVYSNSVKQIAGVDSFAGQEGLGEFLSRSEYLINLLPLTADTRGVLNKSLFDRLPKGAVLINVARGAHLIEEDLIPALVSGQLSHAFLDVFLEEPLPSSHPFWARDDIFISPHVASITGTSEAVQVIAANYRRLRSGKPLLFEVDRAKAY